MNFSTYLKEKRESLGLSQNQCSKLIGITQSYYNGVERGETKNPPSEDVLDKIISVFQLSPEEGAKLKYLAAIERTPSIILNELEKLREIKYKMHQNAVKEQVEKDALIPLFSRISAGVGAITEEDPIDYISIPGIRDIQNIFAINVKGDSMEPTIKDKSIILCKKSGDLRDGDVAAFLVNGESYVKRIKITRNYYALLSDNPNYQPIYVYPDDEFKVIGKVFKVINDIK